MDATVSGSKLNSHLADQLPKLGFGVGLRSCHFEWLLKNDLNPASHASVERPVDWFEIISENFMDNPQKSHHGGKLTRVVRGPGFSYGACTARQVAASD